MVIKHYLITGLKNRLVIHSNIQNITLGVDTIGININVQGL